MTKFQSRFNYKPLVAALFVPTLVGIIGMLVLIENIDHGNAFNDWGFTIAMPILLFSFIVASVRYTNRLSPRIIITNSEIIIGRSKISAKDVRAVSVRGKTEDSFLLMPFRYQSCSIFLADDTEYTIAVENYSNGNIVRANFDTLNNYILGKTENLLPIEGHNERIKSFGVIDTRTAKKIHAICSCRQDSAYSKLKTLTT